MEAANGKGIWWNIQRLRYGRDLQGIIEEPTPCRTSALPRLTLTRRSSSLHKYDGACYHHIDPTFGPDPVGDRKLMAAETPDDPNTWVWTAADKLALKLIHEVHRRGMHVIFDGVFNHVGINSFAFQDVKCNQQASRLTIRN